MILVNYISICKYYSMTQVCLQGKIKINPGRGNFLINTT